MPSLFARIVECGPYSAILEESHADAKKRGRSRYDAGFKPWLMTYRGRPESYLPQLQENFALGVDVIRVVDGSRRQTSVEASYNLRNHHPCYCGCDDPDSPYEIYDDYMEAFFLKSPSKLSHASNFRYQAGQYSSAEGTQVLPKLSFEMDFASALGNTWQYRRHKRTREDVFDAICDQDCCCEMCYDHEHPFGVSAILHPAQPNPFCPCHANKFVIPLRNSSTVLLSQHGSRNSFLQLYESMSTSQLAFPSTRPFRHECRTASLAKEFGSSPIFAWTSRKAMQSSPLTCMSITVTTHKPLVATWNQCSVHASYANRKWRRR
jgi:hypothetical protein